MAYLNYKEREELLNQLKDMNFFWARWKLRRLDPKGRVAYFRNSQETGKLYTRYVLEGMGTQVTLVEEMIGGPDQPRGRVKMLMTEVIVEPTPDNRT